MIEILVGILFVCVFLLLQQALADHNNLKALHDNFLTMVKNSRDMVKLIESQQHQIDKLKEKR